MTHIMMTRDIIIHRTNKQYRITTCSRQDNICNNNSQKIVSGGKKVASTSYFALIIINGTTMSAAARAHAATPTHDDASTQGTYYFC
jgi:hypothetical protein